MKNSVILSFIINISITVKTWFLNSVYYKIWENIMNFFGRLYNKSVTSFLFSKKIDKKYVENSLFYKFISFLFNCFDVLFGKSLRNLVSYAKKSKIIQLLAFLFSNWQYISIRYYGVFVFAFGTISMAIDRALNGFISNRWIAITLASLLLMLINRSFASLINGEFFVKFFDLKIFDDEKTIETKSYTSLAVSIFFGAFFGAAHIVPGLQLVLIALLGGIYLCYNAGSVIYIAVVFLPFLPTMALVGLMLFASFITFLKYFSKKYSSFRLDILDLAMVGFIFMNIYGVLCSQSRASSIKIAAVYISFIIFFFCLRRFLGNIKNFFLFLDSFIVSATLVAGYGIIEQIFGLSEKTWQDEEMFEEISGRVCSTFENPNVLGEFFLLTIPLTIARLYNAKNYKTKTLLVISSIMQILCMVFTYSRGCWIGILFAMAIFIVLCAKKVFVAMSLGVFALPFIIPQSIIDRLLSIGNTSDTSTAYRVFIWEGTLKMLKDNWLSGIGLGSDAFNSVYPRYALGAITAPHPHNLYLLIFSETGIIGFVLFLVAVISYFRMTGNITKSSSAYRPLGVAFACALGGYLLQGMFDNVWYNYRIYALFIIIFAFVGALKDITEELHND